MRVFAPCIPAALFAAAALLPSPLSAEVAYNAHVVFDNSPVEGAYYHSSVEVVAPSSVEHLGGHAEIVKDRTVSPPNAVRLHWKSAPGGDWRVALGVPGKDWRKYEFDGDTLSFWCWSDTEITAANSPRVTMKDRFDNWAHPRTLVSGNDRLPAHTWVRVRLPFGQIDPFCREPSGKPFQLRHAVSVIFLQGLDDNAEHTLYVDDILVLDGATADTEAPAAPSHLTVRGYERHCDLSWNPSPSPDVVSYRIHRSTDGAHYVPVATQRNAWTRFEDFLGAPSQNVSYRISAIDLAGNESPLCERAGATTHPMSDEELLDMVQLGCFRFYWETGHPDSGLCAEIQPGNRNLIAVGGNGFGVMALIAATERQFVTRDQSVERMLKIVRFLARADRFHGAWPHFLDGSTGRAVAHFGPYDDGGDLVETAFVVQGLLAARQYFTADTPEEREIRDTAARLWREVEWDWYRKSPDSDYLLWHWSPRHGFVINHPLIGWNETMIVYLLAIASPTHPVPASLYHSGWAGQSPQLVAYRQNWGHTSEGDHYANGNRYYGIRLDVGVGRGGELFFTQFSFLGFDPRGLRDRYANYFVNNRAQAFINRAYCIENPLQMAGYGPDCWGRSAGVNSGGAQPLPRGDNGTISCMAALASMPYTPEESMTVLRHFYRDLGPKIWGTYGFHDGFNPTQNWFDEDYMSLDQAPIVVMIENHRSGLLWKMFMANPEIAPALAAIGFKPDAEVAEGR